MLVMLPNGLLDGQDHFNIAEIDELRGKQQNYLVDKELVVGNIGHLPKILADMILSLQTKEGVHWKGDMSEAIYKLPSGDLETILVKVRENTYGPKFYHEAECPHCQHINKNLRLDLDKLEIKHYPLEQMLTKKVVQLPKANVEVELKPIYLKDLFEVVKITKNKHDALVTSLMAVSIKRIGDNAKIDSSSIEKIAASDLMHLQEEMSKVTLEGSIDTNIQIDCSKCEKEFEIKLNCFDPSFFDHTKGSKSTTI